MKNTFAPELRERLKSELLNFFKETAGGKKMKLARLGKNGPELSRVGYGAMVLEGCYGEVEQSEALATLEHAIKHNMMIDTSDAYGAGRNERLIGQAIKRSKKSPFLSSKFGIVTDKKFEATPIHSGSGFALNISNSENYFRHCLEGSLERLGVSKIDLYYVHYIDPKFPIEETVKYMERAKEEGLIDHIGLSNVGAADLSKVATRGSISAVQLEYSMCNRQVEKELMGILLDNEISLVACSPLGGGFLSGQIDKLDPKDFRNNNPHYSGHNLSENLLRLEPLKQVATGLGVTCAQLALTWLLHQHENVFAIAGTRKKSRVDENLQSLDFKLGPDLLGELARLLEKTF